MSQMEKLNSMRLCHGFFGTGVLCIITCICEVRSQFKDGIRRRSIYSRIDHYTDKRVIYSNTSLPFSLFESDFIFFTFRMNDDRILMVRYGCDVCRVPLCTFCFHVYLLIIVCAANHLIL